MCCRVPGVGGLGGGFVSDEFSAALDDADADYQDAQRAEEQHGVAGKGDSVEVYGRHMLGDHKDYEAA